MRKQLVFATRAAQRATPVPCSKDAAKAFANGSAVERVARIMDGTRILALGEGRAIYMQFMTRQQMKHWGI